MYVIIYDRHAGDDINNSHHEYGVFDVDNSKRINGKHLQCNDNKQTLSTATTNITSNNKKWTRRG